MKNNSSKEDFEELALPLQNDLYFLGLKLSHNEAMANDLVQEAYLKAFRSFDSYEQGRSFKSWIFTILHNTYIDICRRKRIEPDLIDTSALPLKAEESISQEYDIDLVFSDRIRNAFDTLSKNQQILLILSDIEQLTYKEISETLSRPIGTVMSGLFYAREKLRDHLQSE